MSYLRILFLVRIFSNSARVPVLVPSFHLGVRHVELFRERRSLNRREIFLFGEALLQYSYLISAAKHNMHI